MKKPLNCITVNTDASFYKQQGVGGWAFYIVCDDFKLKGSGKFKIQPKDSLEAELMAMANAFAAIAMRKELPECKLIILNSDCTYAFDAIGLKKKGVGKVVAQQLKICRERMAINGLILPDFDFRHVKAHSGKNDKRSWVNEWCDSEAKRQARLSIKELEKQKVETMKPETKKSQKRISAENLKNEVWKPLGIYSDYEISNMQRVKHRKHVISVVYKGRQIQRTMPDKILRQFVKRADQPAKYVLLTLYYTDRSQSKSINVRKYFERAFPKLTWNDNLNNEKR